MTTTDLKAKEEIYEVVEPRYFEKAESLSEQDDQGAIYEFLEGIGSDDYKEWLKGHEDNYYFEVVRVGDTYYAIANEDYTTPAWAVEIEPINE